MAVKNERPYSASFGPGSAHVQTPVIGCDDLEIDRFGLPLGNQVPPVVDKAPKGLLLINPIGILLFDFLAHSPRERVVFEREPKFREGIWTVDRDVRPRFHANQAV